MSKVINLSKKKAIEWCTWKSSMRKNLNLRNLNLSATEVRRHSEKVAIGGITFKRNFGLIGRNQTKKACSRKEGNGAHARFGVKSLKER